MFAKISNSFLDLSIDYHQFKSNVIMDQYYSSARKGGSVFYRITQYLKFKEVHLKDIFTIQPNVFYAKFTGGGLVTPHTDGGNHSVALNFYLTAPGDATIFYEKKNDSIQPYPDTQSYNIADLTETSRFYASPLDAYLMDVSKIHGIQKSGFEPRNMISYRWKNYSFEEIFNSLNIEKAL
jgi:hypothetical protein